MKNFNAFLQYCSCPKILMHFIIFPKILMHLQYLCIFQYCTTTLPHNANELTKSSFLMSDYFFPGWIRNSLHGIRSHGFGHPWRHLIRHDLVLHGNAILAFGILLLVRSKSCLLGNPQGGNSYLANALPRGKEISTDVNWRSFLRKPLFLFILISFYLIRRLLCFTDFDTEWCFVRYSISK